MTTEPIDPFARFEELLITELLFGLTPEELVELGEVRGRVSHEHLHSIREVIGRLDAVRALSDGASLPALLRERIRRDAAGQLPQPAVQKPLGNRYATEKTSWLITIASLVIAVVTLVFYGPWSRGRERFQSDSEIRANLLTSAPDIAKAEWTPGPTPIPGAAGDVVWSTSRQQGFMRFQGMRVNDPTVEQYQLWIFDKNQDESTPIDGGVFDVSSNGEIVIAVRPALQVRDPHLFAVTIEKPGGVVVSGRQRLPLLATLRR